MRRALSVAVSAVLVAAVVLLAAIAGLMAFFGPGNLEIAPFGEEGGMPTESAFAWSVVLQCATLSLAALRAWWPSIRRQARRESALWKEMRAEIAEGRTARRDYGTNGG